MDNYLGLIEEIKKTISLKLAQKAEKQKELLREQGKLEQNLNRKKDITDNLKENNKNLETLKSYQNSPFKSSSRIFNVFDKKSFKRREK